MRVTRAFCALLFVVSCAPLAAAGQHDPLTADVRDPALPPAVPPPLYFPRRFDRLAFAPQTTKRLQSMPVSLVRQRQAPPTDGFKPISELPPEEKLPAAPLLVAAYVFVVLALFAYVVSLSRRLNAVGREIARINAQLKRH